MLLHVLNPVPLLAPAILPTLLARIVILKAEEIVSGANKTILADPPPILAIAS